MKAGPSEASFLGNEKYANDFLATKAGVVIVPPVVTEGPEGVAFDSLREPELGILYCGCAICGRLGCRGAWGASPGDRCAERAV